MHRRANGTVTLFPETPSAPQMTRAPLGGQEALHRHIQETSTFQKAAPAVSCVKGSLLPCIPPGARPRISEDVALPQEEEGTSCHWMCGLRAARHFPNALAWAVGTWGDAAWVPSQHCWS